MRNNPYVGPRPYRRQDRHNFHGRDREARKLRSLILSAREVLFYAQSGAGKTSLLNARVIPALEEEGFYVLHVERVGSELPPGIVLGREDNVFVFSTLLSLVDENADPKTLLRRTLYSFLEERFEREKASSIDNVISEDDEFHPRVLIIDQFEEIFTMHRDRWQDIAGFFRQVREALDALPDLGVVFAMREDHVAAIDPYAPIFPRRLRTRFRMERLGEKGALDAVRKPAAQAGRPFAPGVAEWLVDNLRRIKVPSYGATQRDVLGPQPEPTHTMGIPDYLDPIHGQADGVLGPYVEAVQLQVACSRVWENLANEENTEIQRKDVGDVDQALTEFYEWSIKQAARGVGVDEQDLRKWFDENLITPAGTRANVYRGPEKTGGVPNTAVDELADLHLIRGEWRAGARWYELTHDRLIEPIQESNQAWREKQARDALAKEQAKRESLKNRFLIAGLVAAILVAAAFIWLATRPESDTESCEWLEKEFEIEDKRLESLATMLRLSECESKARELFFDLAPGDQHAVFSELSPDQLPDVINVVEAIYVYPSDAEDNEEENDALLEKMRSALKPEEDVNDVLADGIRYWIDGRIAKRAREYQSAYGYLNAAIRKFAEIEYENPAVYLERALILAARGDYEDALSDFETVLKLDEDENPTIYFQRALIFAAMGNYEDALTDFETVLALDEDEDAQERVQERIGQNDQLYARLWSNEKAHPALAALVSTPTFVPIAAGATAIPNARSTAVVDAFATLDAAPTARVPTPVLTTTSTPKIGYGMNVNPQDPKGQPQQVDLVQDLDWMRFVFSIAAAQFVNADQAFEFYDPIIERYHQTGVRSLLILNAETFWGNGPWDRGDWSTYANGFAELAGTIAAHYAGQGVAYQIWQEPDIYGPASVFVEPEDYALVLAQASAAIKAQDPDAQVVFGGLASGAENAINYVKAVRQAMGGRLPVDAIGIHPYGFWGSSGMPEIPTGWFGPLDPTLEDYASEFDDTPIWITEIGVSEPEGLPSSYWPQIAAYMEDVFTLVEQRYASDVPVVIWFAWSDSMRGAGIVDVNGDPKQPIYDRFFEIIRDPKSTTEPAATATPTPTSTPTFTPTQPRVTTINVSWLSIQPGTTVVPDETVIQVGIDYSFSQPDLLAAITVDTVLFESPDCTYGGPWDVQPTLADQNGGIKTGQSSGTLTVPKSISSSTIQRAPTPANVKAVSFLIRLYQEDVELVWAEDAAYSAHCYPLQ